MYVVVRLLLCALFAGLASCGGQINDVEKNPQFMSSVSTASETETETAYHRVVQQVYVAYFGRPADPAGLAIYSKNYANAAAPKDIVGLSEAYASNPGVVALVDSFALSQESTDLYPGDSVVFITAIYRNLFNRSPDAAGLAFWANALDANHITRANAAISLMAGAKGADIIAIENKTLVASTFTASLTSDEDIAAYSGMTANSLVRTALYEVDQTTDPLTVGSIVAVMRAALTPTFTQVSAGFTHSVALQNDGTVWTWGGNEVGQLGDGTKTFRSHPTPVGFGYSTIAASGGSVVGLKKDGTIWSWGRNDWGQLGIGNSAPPGNIATPQSSPQLVGDGFKSVAVGAFHVLAIRHDGSVAAWGDNTYGQLGDGSTVLRYTPVPVTVGSGFIKVAGGVLSSYGLKADGTLWAWGYNGSGELGDGTTTPRQYPVQVGERFTQIIAGDQCAFGIKADGTLWAWGNNAEGQLGDGTTIDRNRPVQIGTGFTSVVSAGYGTNRFQRYDVFGNITETIRRGGAHTLAIKDDQTLWGWGGNSFGEVGDGTTTQRNLPVKIGEGFISIAASGYEENAHSIAVKSDGSVWAWGGKPNGQDENGSITPQRVPTKISFQLK